MTSTTSSSCCCLVIKLCLALLQPHGLYNSRGFSVCGIFQVRILEWAVISFSMGSSQSRDRTRVFLMAGGFSTTEPLGKPRTVSYAQSNVMNSCSYYNCLRCGRNIREMVERVSTDITITFHNPLLFRRFSGVFSSTTVRRHQFFSTLPSLWSSSHNQM